MFRLCCVAIFFYIAFEWTTAMVCPEGMEGKVKFGRTWEKVERSGHNCTTDHWCMEATTESQVRIKSPMQRDGVVVGKVMMCANNETNQICDQMSADGLKCKTVSKVSIGEEGQEWVGKNISLCCSRGTTECHHHSTMLKKNVQGQWESMPVNDEGHCVSENGLCVNIRVKNTAVIGSSGDESQPAFEVKGDMATCSRAHGTTLINCDAIGHGCKTVNEIPFGEQWQMIQGETEICCCKGKLCNA